MTSDGLIYYVCCATAQMQTNLQGLFTLDPAKVAGVLVLVGIEDPERPTEIETSQALVPALGFCEILRAFNYPTPQQIAAPPASFETWRERIAAWIATTAPDGRYVLNITGGPRPIGVGALDAIEAAIGADQSRLSVIYVDRGQFLITRNARPERRRLAELSLDQYLATRGYIERESDRASRLDQEARASLRHEFTERLWAACKAAPDFLNGFNILADVLRRSACEAEGGTVSFPRNSLEAKVLATTSAEGRAPRSEATVRLVLRCLVALLNVSRSTGIMAAWDSSGQVSFAPWCQRFIGGFWFEELVQFALWRRLQDHGVHAGEIAMGIKPYRAGPHGLAPENDHELDIAFILHGRLHVIECKTAAFPTAPERQGLLDRLKAMRHDLTGLHGLVALAHPRIVISQRSPHARRASEAGITLCQGGNVLDQLRTAIDGLFAAA
jgi:hypothetical protein